MKRSPLTRRGGRITDFDFNESAVQMYKVTGTSITNTTPVTVFNAAAGTEGVVRRIQFVQTLTPAMARNTYLCAYYGGRVAEGTLQTAILIGDAMPKVVTLNFNPVGMIAGGLCIIGQELFTATYLSSNSITLTARAQRGSTAAAHSVGKAVKLPSWAIPLGLIPGLSWAPAAGLIAGIHYDTPYSEVLITPVDGFNFWHLDYQMPFNNGLKLTMHAMADVGAVDMSCYGGTFYQSGLPRTWNADYRLFMNASYETGMVPGAGRHTILSRSGGPGYLLGVHMAATATTVDNSDFMESSNPRMIVDGEGTATVQWPGGEDMFNNGYFLSAAVQMQSSGKTAGDNGFGAYCFWDAIPIRWGTSVVFDVMNGGSENVQYEFGTVFYEKTTNV